MVQKMGYFVRCRWVHYLWNDMSSVLVLLMCYKAIHNFLFDSPSITLMPIQILLFALRSSFGSCPRLLCLSGTSVPTILFLRSPFPFPLLSTREERRVLMEERQLTLNCVDRTAGDRSRQRLLRSSNLPGQALISCS